MLKASLNVILVGCLVVQAQSQQPAAQTKKPAAPSSQHGASGFIAPTEASVRIDADVRTVVVMAALNVAGFDYETGGQPLSPARAELRKDLAGLDPQLKAKLAAYYSSHKRAGVDEAVDATRYAALSLMMTPPPGFTIYQQGERAIPDDLQPLIAAEGDLKEGFVSLVREFYVKSGIRQLVPKYMSIAGAFASAYRVPVGAMIYDVLSYFHVQPETVINMRPLVITTGELGGTKQKSTVVNRTRTRQVFVVPDPLGGLDTSAVRGDILNQKEDLLARRVGDDYIVLIGPSRVANVDPVRLALIRFVIDPMVERHLKTSLELKDDILKLVGSVPAAAKQYSNSVYLVIRESLAQATDARLRRIRSMAARGTYGDDDVVFALAQAYLRGAALAFHFYDSLTGYEQVGISIEDFFDQMLATTKFDREATRRKEFEPAVARVSASRSATSRTSGGEVSAATAAMGAMGAKILKSDELIRQKKYPDARAILDEVLAAEPNNARALYGMAQVVTQTGSAVELDPKGDENDKIQAQHDRLERAIKLYRKAIESASKDSERWLMQWSYVFLGRILDFQEFRADAIGEYDKAISLGEVPNGAYKEALDGKQRPFERK